MLLLIHIPKSRLKLMAQVFSRLGGPTVMMPLLVLFLLEQGNLLHLQFLPLIILILTLTWLLPILFFIFCYQRGWISDWNATQRRERLLPYTFTWLCYTLLILNLDKIGLNISIQSIFLKFYWLLFLLWFITFFYKVSVHAALNTFAAFVFINLLVPKNSIYSLFFYGLALLWIFLVAWSRLYLRRHTVGQLLLGFLLGCYSFYFWPLLFESWII